MTSAIIIGIMNTKHTSDAFWSQVNVFVKFYAPCYCVYINRNFTHMRTMRTNIVIDDQLMSEALEATGLSTKKDAVELGLKLLIRQNKQQAIRKLRGKLKWEGDLNEMRAGR